MKILGTSKDISLNLPQFPPQTASILTAIIRGRGSFEHTFWLDNHRGKGSNRLILIVCRKIG